MVIRFGRNDIIDTKKLAEKEQEEEVEEQSGEE